MACGAADLQLRQSFFKPLEFSAMQGDVCSVYGLCVRIRAIIEKVHCRFKAALVAKNLLKVRPMFQYYHTKFAPIQLV
ncbi:hypothetical protein C8240_06270 [Paracidovorax cattleyae]|nr:hypothetical protein C8240_06270 [Paracidovorax cattleyae]